MASGKNKQVDKKDVAKAYEKYAQKFTPKPKYFMNALKAFVVGGAICAASLYLENRFIASGMPEKDTSVYVVIILIMTAQLLTGLGWFDTIGKHVGAPKSTSVFIKRRFRYNRTKSEKHCNYRV